MTDDPYDFAKLMHSAARDIPVKRKLTTGTFKFRCTFTELDENYTFKSDNTTGAQFTMVLKPVASLSDPADDVSNAESITHRVNSKSPSFVREAHGAFIKAHGSIINFTDFSDIVPELKGRFYTATLSPAKDGDNVNVRNLLPVD